MTIRNKTEKEQLKKNLVFTQLFRRGFVAITFLVIIFTIVLALLNSKENFDECNTVLVEKLTSQEIDLKKTMTFYSGLPLISRRWLIDNMRNTAFENDSWIFHLALSNRPARQIKSLLNSTTERSNLKSEIRCKLFFISLGDWRIDYKEFLEIVATSDQVFGAGEFARLSSYTKSIYSNEISCALFNISNARIWSRWDLKKEWFPPKRNLLIEFEAKCKQQIKKIYFVLLNGEFTLQEIADLVVIARNNIDYLLTYHQVTFAVNLDCDLHATYIETFNFIKQFSERLLWARARNQNFAVMTVVKAVTGANLYLASQNWNSV